MLVRRRFLQVLITIATLTVPVRTATGGTGTIGLDSVRFDTAGWTPSQTAPAGGKGWLTPDGDGVRLTFFHNVPDLPRDTRTLADLTASEEALVRNAGGHLVELQVLRIRGVKALLLILSRPQQGSGRTRLGSIILPFREFSFVIKVQAEERGTTGVREAVLLDRQLRAGGDPATILPGFQPDEAKYDPEFPDSPVSRVRRALATIESSLKVDDAVKAAAPWPLPGRE